MKIEKAKVLNGHVWKVGRGVEVSEVRITQGTLRSSSITDYTLAPTFEAHEFMNKIGYSQYLIENKVTGVYWTVEGTTFIELGGLGDVEVLLTEQEFEAWYEYAGAYIPFYRAGQALPEPIDSEFEDWFNTL